MPTTYIHPGAGVDAPGNGTIDRPYQTLAYAIFTTSSAEFDNTVFQIRKFRDDAGYDAPTQSAIKKAKKDAPAPKSAGTDRPVPPVTSVAPKGKMKNKPV